MSDPLYNLSASEAAARIADGTTTAEALLRSCFERIEEREADVGAWIYLNRDRALAAAQALDRSPRRGLLHGVPVGLKDIIDTVDMPTAYGSMIYHSHRPPADAACVHRLRAAGALMLGKTVSTEFAYRRAGKTSNPHDRRYSPGGSSSGSAAAVADRMVPLALGTQTGGSVIRPASYCGVYGLKPTFNLFSFSGVRHLAESFDTLGSMARSLADIALSRSALLGIAHRPLATDLSAPRIAFCRTAFWDQVQPAMQSMLERSAGLLAKAGARVSDFAVEYDGQAILEASWTVTKFEGARTVGYDRINHPESVSSAARGLVDEGNAIALDAYLDAQRRIDQMRMRLESDFSKFDVILTASAAGEAPKGLADTGPVTFNYLWTIAHTPALTMPAGKGPNGLPLGIQLVARRYDEDKLLNVARWVEQKLEHAA